MKCPELLIMRSFWQYSNYTYHVVGAIDIDVDRKVYWIARETVFQRWQDSLFVANGLHQIYQIEISGSLLRTKFPFL